MAARAHLINQLSSRRGSRSPSSQLGEDYATATSFDPARDAIHSTVQLQDYTTQQQLPQQANGGYNQYPDHVSETGSDGSAEMSIELGRGVKRGARQREEDVSSNLVFNVGNDSLYELTATPPIHGLSKKSNENQLRRQASIRRATETATQNGTKRAPSTSMKARSLSEALRNVSVDDTTSLVAEDAATFARNTRFVRSRHTSAAEPPGPTQQHTPRRSAVPNGTVQSNSFILPDMPNLTELVSGVRKDGTPVFSRGKPQSRSRFTSGTHKPAYHPVHSVPIPEEEKRIYASLQLLQDRVNQLELENSEAAKRAEEYEEMLIDLRSQLSVARGRPDSALGSSAGSEDEFQPGQSKTKLQTSVKAFQERLDRSERKISVAEITIKRVTKERDELVTQIGVAYYESEELKAENEDMKTQQGAVARENGEMKEEMEALRKENEDLRLLMRQMEAGYEEETRRREKKKTASEIKDATREILEQRSLSRAGKNGISSTKRSEKRTSVGILDEATSDDLAIRIAQEVRKNRDAAVSRGSGQDIRSGRQPQTTAPTTTRSRSKSQTGQHAVSSSATAPAHRGAPAEGDMEGDNESTTQLDFTRNSKRASLPTPAISVAKPAREEDSREHTSLSLFDPNVMDEMRKKLEEERRANRLSGTRATRATSAPQQDKTKTGTLLTRKSSLKDVTGDLNNITTTRRSHTAGPAEKSVRVQSPHTSDEWSYATKQQQQQQQQSQADGDNVGDTSILSNTSRRRHRRAASEEGMTSAFILPDITLHNTKSIQHQASNCTACDKNATVPTPVPVSDRPEDVADVTNATIRPSQPPPIALANVIKQLEDEIKHLKLKLQAQNRLYYQHDPALSRRRRLNVKVAMDNLTLEIEKRSDQVYGLYDVLEGQKAAGKETEQEAVEETLQSLGIDPVEISGHIGRTAHLGLDDNAQMSDGGSEELPWEGLSSVGSEDDVERVQRRRSGEF